MSISKRPLQLVDALDKMRKEAEQKKAEAIRAERMCLLDGGPGPEEDPAKYEKEMAHQDGVIEAVNKIVDLVLGTQ